MERGTRWQRVREALLLCLGTAALAVAAIAVETLVLLLLLAQ